MEELVDLTIESDESKSVHGNPTVGTLRCLGEAVEASRLMKMSAVSEPSRGFPMAEVSDHEWRESAGTFSSKLRMDQNG